MKPMLLIEQNDPPVGKMWLYEAKYDGFRCLLKWENEIPLLLSRNGNVLNEQFPEIITFCNSIYENIKPNLPLLLDGELVYLENDWRSDFTEVQRRGKMRNKDNIDKRASLFPCHYVVFDLLMQQGKSISHLPLSTRKERLTSLFRAIHLPLQVKAEDKRNIQAIKTYKNEKTLWKYIILHNGEGIVAKRQTSMWEENKRSSSWVKIKHWRYVDVVLTSFDEENSYFHGAVYKDDEWKNIVVFQHGFSTEEEESLRAIFKKHGKKEGNIWMIPPSIIVTIACIGFDGKALREPKFSTFRFDKDPYDCHWRAMQRELHPLPPTISITHPEKPIWPKHSIVKDDYILYLQQIAPFMIPFLKDRHLTVIRYPHGAGDERFFQKNCPDYAPSFVKTDEQYIVCQDVETLLWLGNQLALEFHIPFQTIKRTTPAEIVFDLDPPSSEHFYLAVEAALLLKEVFDQFNLISFVKTSGGKGLQLYLPLPENKFTYDETRIFTEFVCRYVFEQRPDLFTLERLKKKRGERLYLDYIQHDEGKTIIAPFSPRGNEFALVATPLYWDEVCDSLDPTNFNVVTVIERLKKEGNPFRTFFESKQKQPFHLVLNELKKIVSLVT